MNVPEICVTMEFREVQFCGRSALHKIGNFYPFDHRRQPRLGQKLNFGS